MSKKDVVLIALGVGFFVALAALLGQWDNALAGAGGMVTKEEGRWNYRRH